MYFYNIMERIKKRKNNYFKQQKQYNLWIDLNNNLKMYNKLIQNCDNEKIINLGIEINSYLTRINKKAKNIGCGKKNKIFSIIHHHQSVLKKMDPIKTRYTIKELYFTTSKKYYNISNNI